MYYDYNVTMALTPTARDSEVATRLWERSVQDTHLEERELYGISKRLILGD